MAHPHDPAHVPTIDELDKSHRRKVNVIALIVLAVIVFGVALWWLMVVAAGTPGNTNV